METDTLLFIIYLVVNFVLQLLFSCTKYWPKNHFWACLFFCATICFTPFIMFPLQYLLVRLLNSECKDGYDYETDGCVFDD